MNDHVASVVEQVRGVLSRFIGTEPRREADNVFAVARGSSKTFVGVFEHQGDVVVNVRSMVVFGPKVDGELAEYLLRENGRLVYGGFALDDDGNVVFQQTIPARGVDEREIATAVAAVSRTADLYDDDITAKWGGQTARGRFDDRKP